MNYEKDQEIKKNKKKGIIIIALVPIQVIVSVWVWYFFWKIIPDGHELPKCITQAVMAIVGLVLAVFNIARGASLAQYGEDIF